MKDELKQYQVEPDLAFQSTWRYGGGYDTLEAVQAYKWHAIPSWGRDGYDLGNWPLIIVFYKTVKNTEGTMFFNVAEYCEGDVTQYTCPTPEIREEITNNIAFWHWKFQDEDWVKGYETVDDLPDELKGPYRSS